MHDEPFSDAALKRVSKRMALLLRHDPASAGLVLDAEGYVLIDDLVTALRRDLPDTRAATVHAVVERIDPHKRRYSIEGDCIRANYGHSTADAIEHAAAVPPDVLLHGTSTAALEQILREGLLPMRRQYVHLTPDAALARSVGSRHGKACLVRVDARGAHEAGTVFHQANASFWLVRSIEPRFLSVDAAP